MVGSYNLIEVLVLWTWRGRRRLPMWCTHGSCLRRAYARRPRRRHLRRHGRDFSACEFDVNIDTRSVIGMA